MVAIALLSVIERCSTQGPVLLVIDDAQWLDASSRAAIGFAARRLTGPVGMVLSFRTGDPDSADERSWLQFRRPGEPRPGEHAAAEPSSVARPDRGSTGPHSAASDDDTDLRNLRRQSTFRDRVGRSRRPTTSPPAKSSCPTVWPHWCATASVTPTTPPLQYCWPRRAAPHRPSSRSPCHRHVDGECRRDPRIDGASRASSSSTANRVRFTHPLFATGVYTNAASARRRAMHRTLATIVERPEIKARHLALAATTGDETMLSALDAAADATIAQGAPAVAAELLELAMKLGGDIVRRRIRAGELHFRAGSFARRAITCRRRSPTRRPGRCAVWRLMWLGGVNAYDDDMAGAVEAMSEAVDEVGDNPALELMCRLRLALALVMTDRLDEALRLVDDAVELPIGSACRVCKARHGRSGWPPRLSPAGASIDQNVADGSGTRRSLQRRDHVFSCQRRRGDDPRLYRRSRPRPSPDACRSPADARRRHRGRHHLGGCAYGAGRDLVWALRRCCPRPHMRRWSAPSRWVGNSRS